MVFIKSLKNGFGDWSSIQFSRIHSPRFIYKTYNKSTKTFVVVFHSTKALVKSRLPKLHCDLWLCGKCRLLSGDQLKGKKSTKKDVWLVLFKMAHIKVPEIDLTSVTINQLVPMSHSPDSSAQICVSQWFGVLERNKQYFLPCSWCSILYSWYWNVSQIAHLGNGTVVEVIS